jgi:acetylornithine deacetylase/succinyl-diaminopimelate desuccinylase-like protein
MKQLVGVTAVITMLILAVPVFAVIPLTEADATDPNTVILDMVEQVNESMVFYYLDSLMSFGPRYTGSENCSAAAQWILDEFMTMGLDTQLDTWSYAGFSSQNVVATLNGSENAEIILSAHYDCTPGSLGADDDGSGIAAMMAAAELMSQHTFNHTVRFIAFSGEEVGTYGSFSYARKAYERGDTIRAVVNLDMVGYADTARGGSMVRMFSTERTEWLADFSRAVAAWYPSLDMSVDVVPN